MTISNELLDELLKGCARPEDLFGEAGLMKKLKLRLMLRRYRGPRWGRVSPKHDAGRRVDRASWLRGGCRAAFGAGQPAQWRHDKAGKGS